MSNITQLLLKDEQNFIDVAKLTFYASTTITLESAFALFINLYLLSVRFLIISIIFIHK